MAELKESKKDKRERKAEKKEKKVKKEKSDKPEAGGEEEAAEVESAEGAEKSASQSDSELEIDLKAAVPLSKKRQRLLKKGKLDLDKLARKNPPPKAIGEEEPASKKSPFGTWIGNLAFDTTREDIIRWIVAKTADNGDESVAVKEEDITRVNVPKKENKIKGFAYVDLPSQKHVDAVVALSEGILNGRKLLIKNASSFEGRPEEHKNKSLSKNPPSRILFVGNLPFDATDDLLEEHFRGCGKIVKIRMATFEDSGKCKGFAFIDYMDDTGPTAALKSKVHKNFMNRNLRMEYGEDRSKRAPKRPFVEREESDGFASAPEEKPQYKERPQERPQEERPLHQERPKPAYKRPVERTFDNKRMKSSIALATAQRASAAIVPSQGKKKTFD